MNLRPMLIVNGMLMAGMAALSIWGWQAIPDGAQLPVHYNLEGIPDRFAGKSEALIVMPAIALAITALLWVIPYFDPRRANIEASMKFWNAAAIVAVGLLAYVHTLHVLNGVGYKIDVTSALIPAMCVAFMGLGNYLGKTRSNWFGGVRTPWSLSSEYSWERTHRWTGRMMVVSGLIGLIAWFVLEAKVAVLVLIGLIVASMIAAVVLSYVFWRADPDRTANGTSH